MKKKLPVENGVILEEIVKKVEEAVAREDCFQALLFQFVFIEAMLRNRIFALAKKRPNAESFCYDHRTKHGHLVDGFELLGGEADLVKNLREYGKKRNKVVHEILQFSSYQELNELAEDALKLGSKIHSVLRIPPNSGA
jgi:hypothetical protein